MCIDPFMYLQFANSISGTDLKLRFCLKPEEPKRFILTQIILPELFLWQTLLLLIPQLICLVHRIRWKEIWGFTLRTALLLTNWIAAHGSSSVTVQTAAYPRQHIANVVIYYEFVLLLFIYPIKVKYFSSSSSILNSITFLQTFCLKIYIFRPFCCCILHQRWHICNTSIDKEHNRPF